MTHPSTLLPIHVEQRGPAGGDPVLLLGGLSDAHDAWGYQLEGELSQTYRLIAPDNRGTGRSPLPPEGTSIELMAEDAASVLRRLDCGPAHVAGFSGGGMIAQVLAVRYPELVRSLVLVGTFCRPTARFSALGPTWLALMEHAPEEVFLDLLLTWVYSPQAHADGRVAAWKQQAIEHPYPPVPEGMVQYLQSAIVHDTSAELPHLDVPALVVHGGEDTIITPDAGRDLAGLLPGSRYVEMPGLGHQPFHEDPAGFDALVAAFLATVP
ncbi:MAG: alpha/beta hydrolase [Solirubrobacterales bacterium]|nr:alpha/beta hydrolase [Solirubrobacterales bacterium]